MAAAITDRLLFGKSAHRLEDEAAAWIMLVPLPLAGMRLGMRDSMAASVIVNRLRLRRGFGVGCWSVLVFVARGRDWTYTWQIFGGKHIRLLSVLHVE